MPFFKTFYTFIFSHIRLVREIIRYVFSFFFAWLFSALVSDFPFFKHLLIQSIGLDAKLLSLQIYITEKLLNSLGYITFSNNDFLQIIDTKGIIFGYGCLGIRQLSLFLIFIILQYGKWKNKIWYIPIGIILIISLNTIRAAIIAISQVYYPDKSIFVHDLASPILMYPTILFLWIFWVVKFGKPTEKSILIVPLIKKTSSIFRLRKK